jgi:hypothetical protein
MALDAPGLEKSEITVYYEPIGGKNAEGQPYMRLLPFVKVRPFDSVHGHTGNNEYYMPSAEQYQVQSAQQEPYRQVLESRNSGRIQDVHEFHNI